MTLKKHTWKANDTEVERMKGKMMLGVKGNLQNYLIKNEQVYKVKYLIKYWGADQD